MTGLLLQTKLSRQEWKKLDWSWPPRAGSERVEQERTAAEQGCAKADMMGLWTQRPV